MLKDCGKGDELRSEFKNNDVEVLIVKHDLHKDAPFSFSYDFKNLMIFNKTDYSLE